MGIIGIGDARGVGVLSGRARAHQRVVAFDLRLAAVEYCVVAQVGVKKTDILAGRRVLVSGESATAVGPSLPFPFIPNDSRHSDTATRLRSLLSACWPWCQRRTRSRHTPRRLLRCRWSRASSHSILTNPYQNRDRSEERRVGKECRSRWSP